jgi:dihydropteroate synthase
MSNFRVPSIMGVINCTPDSFYAGSRSNGVKVSREIAIKMIRDGAEILDVGGESTRPGSTGVDKDEQIGRVVPVIQSIRNISDITISIDTRNAQVAEAALNVGADIINDISALQADDSMASLAAERGVPVILMHMKGIPETMQLNPRYRNPVSEIRNELIKSIETARKAGIKKEDIILDPGIGFGKNLEANTALLGKIDKWRPEGYQILIGLSRKSFLGRIIDDEDKRSMKHFRRHITEPAEETITVDGQEYVSTPEDRLMATTAAHAWCLTKGVDILRVHDVKEARQLIAVWEALSWAS